MNHASNARYFVSYASANDEPYHTDLTHLHSMINFSSGVGVVNMYISISKVVDREFCDGLFRLVCWLISLGSKNLKIKSITIKDNVGRDFSSHHHNCQKIFRSGKDTDFVLFLNRSAYGPLSDNWFLDYLNLYNGFSDVSIAGTTINFLGHPSITTEGPTSHVQTYAFLMRVGDCKKYLMSLPAQHEENRLRIIAYGEIELSKRVLLSGKAITCLAWPSYIFTLQNQNVDHLPRRDIKAEVTGLPFLHRYGRYVIRPHYYLILFDLLHTTVKGWVLGRQ
jgi:hypothetical protein